MKRTDDSGMNDEGVFYLLVWITGILILAGIIWLKERFKL
jgi:hypothetical protein